ncbi:MAG TPA: hypothetical protein PKO10_00735 [Aliarcobacter cryaerophilus]|nr:hypothetical protein [Aliarcobacter cryaerophilus]
MSKIKIINDKGEEEEIDAFTEAEVTAKVKEKEEEFTKVIGEKDETLKNLTKEKDELVKKAGDIKQDNPNFAILKSALDKKDKEIEDIKISLEKDKEERKISGLITKFTRGNEELEKKIRFHLENSVAGMKSDTPENLTKKIDAAIKLSQDFGSEGIFDGGVGGGGKGGDIKGGDNGGVEFTAKEKALGAKLGISEEDYKKYGPKLK